MTNPEYDALNLLSDVELEVEEVAALVFVTWDSFENGGFKPELEDYAPALRTLRYKATELEKHFKEAHEKLWNVHKEAGAAG